MGTKIIFLGDLHFRADEPFYSMQKTFVEWFHNQSFNNSDNILIQTGDFFDSSSNSGEVNDLALSFFGGNKFKKTYICKGNHDEKIGDATKVFNQLKNVEVIREPKKIDIENENFLFLPYYYASKTGLPVMREYYNKLPKELYENCNYMVYHTEDETNGFEKIINYEYLNIPNRIGGHIHISSENFIGTPYNTRYDERNKKSFLRVLDLETKKIELLEIPKLLDYYDIVYGEELREDYQAKFKIFNIYDSPFKDAWKDLYPNIYVREENLKIIDSENLLLENYEEISTNKLIDSFFVDEKISELVAKEIRSKL